MQLMTERQRAYFLQKPVAALAFITFGRNSQTIYSLDIPVLYQPSTCIYIYMDTCVYTHAKRSHTPVKDPVVHVTVQWTVEKQNNPACTESVE